MTERSAGARRQALWRQRARQGRRVISIEVSDAITAALVAAGRLSEGDIEDKSLIAEALTLWLSATLQKTETRYSSYGEKGGLNILSVFGSEVNGIGGDDETE